MQKIWIDALKFEKFGGFIPDSADGCTMDVEWVRIYDKR